MAVVLKEGRAVAGQEAVLERPDGTRMPFMAFPSPLRDGRGRGRGERLADQRRVEVEHDIHHGAAHRSNIDRSALCTNSCWNNGSNVTAPDRVCSFAVIARVLHRAER